MNSIFFFTPFFQGMSEEMFKVLEWIVDDGLKPNFKSYATMLEGIGHPRSNASWNSLAKLVHQMKADGHCLQDLLLVDDYSPKSLSHILKAVSKIELNFGLNPRKVETESERFTHFSVLKRYLESEVSFAEISAFIILTIISLNIFFILPLGLRGESTSRRRQRR